MQTARVSSFTPLAPRTQQRNVSCASSGKTDLNKAGVNKIKNKSIKNNLQGRSDKMKANNWVDASGRPRTSPHQLTLFYTVRCRGRPEARAAAESQPACVVSDRDVAPVLHVPALVPGFSPSHPPFGDLAASSSAALCASVMQVVRASVVSAAPRPRRASRLRMCHQPSRAVCSFCATLHLHGKPDGSRRRRRG
jgi:hypothetical protein